MKKNIIWLLILISLCGYAQTNKAKQLLDKVSQKISSYQSVYLEFDYMIENASQNIHQQTQGNLIFKSGKYVLNYMGVTRIFDGKKIYTIIPENKEVTIEDYSEDAEDEFSVSKVLNFYKKGYTYKWDIQQNNKGRKIQYIELKPEKANTEIRKILLGIDVHQNSIYNLIEIGTSGVKTVLTLTELRGNPDISGVFHFDSEKYKKQGYYISEF